MTYLGQLVRFQETINEKMRTDKDVRRIGECGWRARVFLFQGFKHTKCRLQGGGVSRIQFLGRWQYQRSRGVLDSWDMANFRPHNTVDCHKRQGHIKCSIPSTPEITLVFALDPSRIHRNPKGEIFCDFCDVWMPLRRVENPQSWERK